MKLFGFNITREKEPQAAKTVWDAPVPLQKVQLPKAVPPAVLPSIKNVALTYNAERGSGRGLFVSPEYDLAQIGRIEDTDGYVNQAFIKKSALMFKEGYDFVGKNLATVAYLRARLAQIAKVSSIPTDALLRDIGAGLIKKSNCFLVKVRKQSASGGRVRTTPEGKQLQPVAGYFIVPAETMMVDADEFGRVRRWKQQLPSGDEKEYRPDDIIHFNINRKEGFLFGTPTITPVVDDIRALRKIEENIELLVYQYLFPLFHYVVGTEKQPATITESGEHEVDIVRREIQYMPSEGGIVTPERHEIRMIGAEGRAMHAEGYLEHFKKRVFSGLGISAVDVGEGETANRATADNMSRALIDSVKDIQAVVENQFIQYVIQELLLESTFGDEVLNEENLVRLKFREIDIDKRIKVEKHALESFEGNAITHPELRDAFGREPIELPSEEVEDTELVEWNQISWKLIEEPKALIQAVDEPFSPGAKAAAENPSTAVTPQNVVEAGEEETAAEIKKIKAKPKPKPPAKKKVKNSLKDSFLSEMYDDLEENVLSLITKGRNSNTPDPRAFSPEYLRNLAELQGTEMSKKLLTKSMSAFLRGYSDNTLQPVREEFLLVVRKDLQARAAKYTSRLVKNVIAAVNRQIDSASPDARLSLIRAAFSSFRYRANLIADAEVRKASSLGYAYALKSKGFSTVTFEVREECQRCAEAAGKVLHIDALTLDDVTPFHGDCLCVLKPTN